MPTPDNEFSPKSPAILESTSPTTGSVTNQIKIGYELFQISNLILLTFIRNLRGFV